MDVGYTTLLLFAALVVLLTTGLPLAFVLGAVAVIFTYFMWGPNALMAMASNALGVSQNFILSGIPLFIFMGVVLQKSGLAGALYEMVYKWVGGIRGGLAVGTVIICMFFAAMTGTSGAATVSMGLIAIPSMLNRGYDKKMVMGSISAGGALGILIPPSVLMIVYSLFAGESVGAMFAGGILPGLLLGGLFILYILIRCLLDPKMGPAIPRHELPSWRERILALRAVALPVALILAVLGTIFWGLATPTEAAAIGAVGALICAAAVGSLSWRVFQEAGFESLRLSCMVVWIIIGGSCFASLYTAIGAVDFIKQVVDALPVGRWMVLLGIQLSFFVLGMLLDPGAIIMICTPVFVPLVKSLGFDPVWFGVLFIVNMEMAYLTPPFGFNLFYMKAIAPPGVTMVDIYKAILPFVAVQAVCMAILMLFPEIVLWLPNLWVR
ncbi:MAG: TRAP transporter large permease subunit [Proteobacteria bacterium]|nr:TRAP transporter large permease subunit [Pseudomonadota bacterium]MBU4385328.1 TRAP transporter large permease subunit [Pseudomonadota bacterium]MBU4604332.1 TRAP transporter large permease subunit [Pseudomonadota bacterium]MCG2764542.1 TRAP transporter large permease subunit [Desulfarculaceae bacterium]